MKVIIKHEGGFSDNKNDPGGVTRYGISLRFLKSALIDIDGDGDSDKDDIIRLTLTDADKIYYREWYKKYKYDRIIDQDLLTDIMDFSINAGACQAHKVLKRAINNIIDNPIKVNCILDKETIEMINLIDPLILHTMLNLQQEDFYIDLVKRNPSLKCFLRGWLRRSAE